MTRTTVVAALAGLVLLAGCDSSTEPSAPPTSQDALTTPTEEPSEDTEATSEPAETPEEATTEEPDADGAPEMPEEATEQTEAGAVAFALHYVEVLNYAMSNPEVGLLEPLALDGCETCDNFEELVEYGANQEEVLAEPMAEVGEVTSIFTDDSARVAIPVTQNAQPFLRDGQAVDRALEEQELSLIVRLQWEDAWRVSTITVD
ncbi:hypothetical protein BJF80_15990 [Serinicoccus sp. CUA-874]|uniref:DUF6318 family protein n=1 Tax=Serinicoccus sp. CUA-874 TaxID=1517939 RepID=UPI00096080E3|nr:DUF6318 family protein [Serinicoccus sp. CUA-874]OLT18315.1 hypothetical protein BJF80_15990 [Serinicoccus sp. CUA-874]